MDQRIRIDESERKFHLTLEEHEICTLNYILIQWMHNHDMSDEPSITKDVHLKVQDSMCQGGIMP